MNATRGPRPSASVVSAEEDAMVKRILEMRKKDCDLLDRTVLTEIIREKWQLLKPLQSKEMDAKEQFVIVLKICFQNAADEALPVSKRRLALESIKTLLEELESKIATQKNNRRDNDDEEETGASHSTSGAYPMHSIVEHMTQPTAKRPNAALLPKSKRPPVSSVRNEAQIPAKVPKKGSNHQSFAHSEPGRTAPAEASTLQAPKVGWAALQHSALAPIGTNALSQSSDVPNHQSPAHSQPNPTTTPAASTPQAPQVGGSTLKNNAQAPVRTNSSIQSNHVPNHQSSAHSQPSRTAAPAASTPQAPKVGWAALHHSAQAPIGTNALSQSNDVPNHQSPAHSQPNPTTTSAVSNPQTPQVGLPALNNNAQAPVRMNASIQSNHVPNHHSSALSQPSRTAAPAASTPRASEIGETTATSVGTDAQRAALAASPSLSLSMMPPNCTPNRTTTPAASKSQALEKGWPDSDTINSVGTDAFNELFPLDQRLTQSASQPFPLSMMPPYFNMHVSGRNLSAGTSTIRPNLFDMPATSLLATRIGGPEPPNPSSGVAHSSMKPAATLSNAAPPSSRNHYMQENPFGNSTHPSTTLPTPSSHQRSSPSGNSALPCTTLTPSSRHNIPQNSAALGYLIPSSSSSPPVSQRNIQEQSIARGNPVRPSTTTASSTRESTEKNELQLMVEPSAIAKIPNMQTIHFPPDHGIPYSLNSTKLKTLSGLIETRINSLKVTCRTNPMNVKMAQDLDRRILEWEPYRKPLGYVTMGLTSTVVSCQPAGNFARTAFSIQMDLTKIKLKVAGKYDTTLANYPGINWGMKSENSLELVLMMFPLIRSEKDQSKRADGHLWPKGSFLVIQKSPHELQQRRQESHDRSLWKGSSHPFDLGSLIKDPRKPVKIDFCSYDEDSYFYCVMLCAVRAPAVLYRELTEPGPRAIERISRDEAMELAAGIAQRQVVQLDCDDDMDTELGKLVFSLFCPLSKTLMETPVRSNNCNHWQCFDLKFFLETNQYISGARWRCGACDPRFVSPRELRICGLTAALIQEFKDVVAPSRNRIELMEDKTYRLIEEKTVRRRGIKRAPSTDGNGEDAKKKQVQEAIVID